MKARTTAVLKCEKKREGKLTKILTFWLPFITHSLQNNYTFLNKSNWCD